MSNTTNARQTVAGGNGSQAVQSVQLLHGSVNVNVNEKNSHRTRRYTQIHINLFSFFFFISCIDVHLSVLCAFVCWYVNHVYFVENFY